MKARPRLKGEGSVYLRDKKWWIKFYHNGTMYRQATGKQPEHGPAIFEGEKDAETKAWAYLANVKKEVGSAELGYSTYVGVRQHKLLVSDVLAAYVEKKKADAIRERRELDSFIMSSTKRALGLWGNLKAVDLTDRFWAKWTTDKAEELLEEFQPATLNRWIGLLRAALHFAVRSKMLATMPCDFTGVMYDESDNARQGFFEHDEFLRLLAAEPDSDLRDLYTFGYFLGWRSGSIKKLKWSKVDLNANYLELPARDEKSRHKNLMPLGKPGDALYDLIHRRWEHRTNDFIFTRKGRPLGDVRKMWMTACVKAGFVKQATDNKGNPLFDENGKPAQTHSKLFHDFRRTAARNIYIATGCNTSLAMSITGHRTDTIFKRYNIIVGTQKEEAIRQVMAHLSRQGQTPLPLLALGTIAGTIPAESATEMLVTA